MTRVLVVGFQPGQLVPGVIRNHQSYGIFVELPGGLRGLAPHKVCVLFCTSHLNGFIWSQLKQETEGIN